MYQEMFENGEKEIRDSIKKIGWTFTKLFIAIWVFVVLVMATYWWGSYALGAFQETTDDVPRVQQYDDLRDNLSSASIKLSENGVNPTVVYIGYTISDEDAIETTKQEVKRYNEEVNSNHANYNAKFTTSLNPSYMHEVDCYFDPETRGILFLKAGTLVDASYQKIK